MSTDINHLKLLKDKENLSYVTNHNHAEVSNDKSEDLPMESSGIYIILNGNFLSPFISL